VLFPFSNRRERARWKSYDPLIEAFVAGIVMGPAYDPGGVAEVRRGLAAICSACARPKAVVGTPLFTISPLFAPVAAAYGVRRLPDHGERLTSADRVASLAQGYLCDRFSSKPKRPADAYVSFSFELMAIAPVASLWWRRCEALLWTFLPFSTTASRGTWRTCCRRTRVPARHISRARRCVLAR